MNPISSGRGLSFLASPSFAQSFSLLHKLSQPWLQTGQVEGARVEHLHHFGIDLRRLSPESPAIDSQEDIHGGEGNSFVAIDEWMVDGQALE